MPNMVVTGGTEYSLYEVSSPLAIEQSGFLQLQGLQSLVAMRSTLLQATSQVRFEQQRGDIEI